MTTAFAWLCEIHIHGGHPVALCSVVSLTKDCVIICFAFGITCLIEVHTVLNIGRVAIIGVVNDFQYCLGFSIFFVHYNTKITQ